MKLKAIAIDDEPLALEILKQYCRQITDVELVRVFDNAADGLAYINTAAPDILFVDIDMPDMNGIELVNNLTIKPITIFTTAYKEFALEGFELDAVDYLLKPFSFERFEKAFLKALSKYKIEGHTTESNHLFVYVDYKMVKILFDNIIYIESLDDYIKIHLNNAKPVMTLMTQKKMMEKLPKHEFMRIHRSYIISINSITKVSGRKVILVSGIELPVSESYSAELTALAKTH